MPIVRAFGNLPKSFAQSDHGKPRHRGPVGRSKDHEPAGGKRAGKAIDKGLRVGNMLDYFHGGDKIKTRLAQILYAASPIIPVQLLTLGMDLGGRDVLRGTVDADDVASQTPPPRPAQPPPPPPLQQPLPDSSAPPPR